jgi:hypothetical protein
MQKWSADFVNDPSDDYNLIVEVLYDDKDVAVIHNIGEGIVIKWYPQACGLEVPIDWLIGLLSIAKERLARD